LHAATMHVSWFVEQFQVTTLLAILTELKCDRCALTPLVQSGKSKWTEQVFEGIEKVGEAMVAVQTGTSTAEVNVKVSDR
jgi:NADPH-dependent curcumin reductase CurA